MDAWLGNYTTVTSIQLSLSIISLIPTVITLATYSCLDVLRYPSFKIIFCLIFTDLVYAIGNLVVWSDPDTLFDKHRCWVQAFFHEWSNLS